MKWLILFAILYGLVVVFLKGSPPLDTSPLHSSAFGDASGFSLVVILFVVCVGIFKFFR